MKSPTVKSILSSLVHGTGSALLCSNNNVSSTLVLKLAFALSTDTLPQCLFLQEGLKHFFCYLSLVL